MSLDENPTYPTTAVDSAIVNHLQGAELKTLDAADHTSVHRRTANALTAVQTVVGLNSHYSGRGSTSVLSLLKTLRTEFDAFRASIGTLTNTILNTPTLHGAKLSSANFLSGSTSTTVTPSVTGTTIATAQPLIISARDIQVSTSGVGGALDPLTIFQSGNALKVATSPENVSVGNFPLTLTINPLSKRFDLVMDGNIQLANSNIAGHNTGQITVGRNASANMEVVAKQQLDNLDVRQTARIRTNTFVGFADATGSYTISYDSPLASAPATVVACGASTSAQSVYVSDSPLPTATEFTVHGLYPYGQFRVNYIVIL